MKLDAVAAKPNGRPSAILRTSVTEGARLKGMERVLGHVRQTRYADPTPGPSPFLGGSGVGLSVNPSSGLSPFDETDIFTITLSASHESRKLSTIP